MTKWFGCIHGHRFITSFHLAALIHHLFVTYYLLFKIDVENHIHKNQHIRVMFEFSARYVTNWNFVVQCIYFSLCLAHDLLQMTDSAVLLKTKENVMHFRNFTFRVFTFPLAFTVSIMFWVLYNFDRSFVFPAEAEALVPSWCNHAVHTNIAILVLVEIATTCHGYSPPESRRTAILSVIVYTTVYFYGTYFEHGVWLYPIYYILNWSQRFLHIFCTYILAVGSYLCGESLSMKIWEKTMPDIHSARRKIQ